MDRLPVRVENNDDLQELYHCLDHTVTGNRNIAWYGQLRALGYSHKTALQGTINKYQLDQEPWWQVRNP